MTTIWHLVSRRILTPPKGSFSGLFDEVSYWAPAQAPQTEVDFLLRRGREFLAIKDTRDEAEASAAISAAQ